MVARTEAVSDEGLRAMLAELVALCSDLHMQDVAAEVWAGVGSYGDAFERAGMDMAAFCEWLKPEFALLQHKHPDAVTAKDFYDYAWKKWPAQLRKLRKAIRVLVGGPVCVTISKAGKRLRQHDARSRQFVDTVEMAAFLGVWLVQIENLFEFLDEDAGDDGHGLYTAYQKALGEHGYILVLEERRIHSGFGGASQRERVFVTAEWEAGALVR